MQIQEETILTGYTTAEKGAYLGVVASLATADRQATEEEKNHIQELVQSAGLSEEQQQAVLRAATELSEDELRKCLDVLKGSNLRFTLITDLIALAKIDNNYSDEEKANIEKISKYLQVDGKQFSFLDQFAKQTVDSGKSADEIAKPGFLESLGLKDQFANAGFNSSSIKNILSVVGPMFLAGLASRGLRGRGGIGGGLLGGNNTGGGLLGGVMGGGLGSLLSGLTRTQGGQGFGGILSKLFR